MRVLVIEDNLGIQANIADYLEKDFTLDFAYNGDQGLELALTNDYDVIVLDLMLPGMDGLELCARYKQQAEVVAPILMLTARDTIDDKDAGFAAGADDYLVKPFSIRELKMRLLALNRRPKSRNIQQQSYAGLMLNTATGILTGKGTEQRLQDKEVTLLAMLMEAAPDMVSSTQISYQLWGDEPPESGALRTHIYNLRQALARSEINIQIKTLRNRGYHLSEESS